MVSGKLSEDNMNLFDDEQDESVMSEAEAQAIIDGAVNPEPEVEAIEQVDDYSEVLSDILTEEETDTLESAMTRLEQARLYEMLIKHNLFDGVDASPVALANVQVEIKDFILSRLQLLLGMKADQKKVTVEKARIALPLNDVEISFIKDLALKATKGNSGLGQTVYVESEIEEIEVVREEPKKPQAPALKKLAPLAQPKAAIKPAATKQAQAPKAQSKQPVRPAPRAPAKKQEELKLEKSPFEMNEAELLEASKLIKKRRIAKPVGIAPIPSMSPQQVEGMYTAKAIQSQNSSDPKVLAGSRILGAIGGAPLVAEADQD